MRITIRSEPAPGDATLVIHMGAGSADTIVKAAVRNYGGYRTLTPDGRGIFAVSVFAVTGGVTEGEILAALPQRSFAHSTVGTVTAAGYVLLGTSLFDADMDPSIEAIQPAHYDIVLPAFDDRRLLHSDPLDDEDLAETASDHLDPHVHRLLTLFGDRHRK